MPLKANLDVCYMCSATPASDARVIAATAVSCLAPGIVSGLLGYASQDSAIRLVPLQRGEFVPITSIQDESFETYSGYEE